MEKEENVKMESKVTTEQPSAAQEQQPREVDLGKFKSVDALMRAYGELEAEFTRRSQRLKALEEQSKERKEPENGKTEPPSVQEQGGVTGDELYRAVMENEGVRARVLSDYLQSLKGVPLLSRTGTGVTAPADRPKSFAEAGDLALGYFKSIK